MIYFISMATSFNIEARFLAKKRWRLYVLFGISGRIRPNIRHIGIGTVRTPMNDSGNERVQ